MSESSTQMDPNRRFTRNIIVNPARQMRFAMALVTGCCVSVILFLTVIVFQVKQTVANMATVYRLDPEVHNSIQQVLTSAVYMSLFLTVAVTALAMIVGLKMSHRIYGPLVSIKRFIGELAEGKYSGRLSLRKNDDMSDIKDALNLLAEALEKRNAR